jgi:hypothetical protein
MSYTQVPDTGMVITEDGDELFTTNLRGEAAMTLAKFYDMAFCRGLIYHHHARLTELREEDYTQADQDITINWQF